MTTTTLPEINLQNKGNLISKPNLKSNELVQPQIDKSTLSHSNEVFGALVFDGELDDATIAQAYVTQDNDAEEDAPDAELIAAQIS